MPRQKSDHAVLAEIKEVIKDMKEDFTVTNYSKQGGKEEAHHLDADLTMELIQDLINGEQNALTRDYKRSKREALKAAIRTPAP